MQESHTIQVISHDGYKANERPKTVILDGQELPVQVIEKNYIATGVDPQSDIHHWFIVRCLGGARFRLLFVEKTGWKGELLPGPRLTTQNEV